MINRQRKTLKRNVLATCWSYPGLQNLVARGSKRSTRKLAAATFFGDFPPPIKSELIGLEEWWSNGELAALQEYEG